MFAKSAWHEPLLVLEEGQAADLMSCCPLSLRAGIPAKEALRLLSDNSCYSAPVIDAAGRLVGVISRADLLGPSYRHREELVPEYYTHSSPERATESTTPAPTTCGIANRSLAEIMTPVVFSVPFDASAAQVVQKLLTWRLLRLFVTDRLGCLIGVISVFDLLRHLRQRTAAEIPDCFPEMDEAE
jgi:CBS-domain-containing membrane protein